MISKTTVIRKKGVNNGTDNFTFTQTPHQLNVSMKAKSSVLPRGHLTTTNKIPRSKVNLNDTDGRVIQEET
jgi:hypothetical protein